LERRAEEWIANRRGWCELTQYESRKTSNRFGFLLFACACLFVFGHDLQYSVQFQAIQEGTGKSVAELVEAGSWVRRIALLALAGASMVSLYAGQPGLNLRKSLAGSPAYLLFLVVAFFSIFWADDPSLTLRRFTEFLIMSGSAFAFARLLSIVDLLKLSLVASLVFIAIGVLSELSLHMFHPTANEYRFCGTLHPNHQAWQCGLLVLSSGALALRKCSTHRHLYVLFGVFGLIFLLLTKSRTTLGALAVALLFLVLCSVTGKQRLRMVGVGSLLAAGTFSASLLFPSVLAGLYSSQLAGRGTDSLSTLTGRLPLWSMALQFVAERPILGYGFYSFWTPAHIQYFSQRLDWDVPESHNGYIELLLSLGLVGLSLYLTLIWRACIKFYRWARSGNHEPMWFPVSLFIFFLLVMFCDVIALDVNLVTIIVFAFVWKAGSESGSNELEGLDEASC
jgi:exopolysaccharide production protein ExoQ